MINVDMVAARISFRLMGMILAGDRDISFGQLTGTASTY
jgi:hypothetical protein